MVALRRARSVLCAAFGLPEPVVVSLLIAASALALAGALSLANRLRR